MHKKKQREVIEFQKSKNKKNIFFEENIFKKGNYTFKRLIN
jgi:hypothetical protein